MENPMKRDVQNVKRTLRYIGGTKQEGVSYSADGDTAYLEAYSDVDYAGDVKPRRSTIGYVINYCSRKQPIVALSTTEAEYISAAECIKETLHLKTLIEDLINVTVKINLFVDNQSTITLMENGYHWSVFCLHKLLPPYI